MPHKDLGRVLGLSAFEDWEKRNPGGTWEEYQESLKGRDGEAGPPGADGKSAYQIWLELGNEGTEQDFINYLAVQNLETRYDENYNTIIKFALSGRRYTNETLIHRGKEGATGGTVGEPQPPGSVPYGTIIEWAGNIPNGWLYTNGGILDKKRYPHMSFLPGTTQPQEPYFKIDGATNLISKGIVENQPTWEFNLGELKGKLYQDFINEKIKGLYFESFLQSSGAYGGVGYSYTGMTNKYYYIELPEKLALSYISMNKTNATGNSIGSSGVANRNVNVYFDIEYMDDNGDWIKGTELHNKTDFVPPVESSKSSIAMIKSSFKSNKFRIIINNKSLQNATVVGINVYYIGEVVFGFDKGGTQYNDYIQLPNEKDNQGRYKLIYVGQPLEIQEPTMYSYNIDNIHNGEVPLSLAVENKIPNYSNGITMSEPNSLKLGYTNKYNSKSDSWELVRTHENKEGYYYDSLGDLKHSPKPSNWVKWDFINHTWNESQELKEEEKQRLIDELIALEIKKDKMIDLKLETNLIVEKIKLINKEIENINR